MEIQYGNICALNEEEKGFVESFKNSHTMEGWPSHISMCCKMNLCSFIVMSYILTLHTVVDHILDDAERRSELEQFSDVMKKDETWREVNHAVPHGKANKSLVKGLAHSGSGVLPQNILLL